MAFGDALCNLGFGCDWTVGCMNSRALNFDSNATLAGPCDIVGCLNDKAQSYDPEATISNGCYGGCTVASARNYDSAAAWYVDGACRFSRVGCMDSRAENFDPMADESLEGLCILPSPALPPATPRLPPLVPPSVPSETIPKQAPPVPPAPVRPPLSPSPQSSDLSPPSAASPQPSLPPSVGPTTIRSVEEDVSVQQSSLPYLIPSVCGGILLLCLLAGAVWCRHKGSCGAASTSQGCGSNSLNILPSWNVHEDLQARGPRVSHWRIGLRPSMPVNVVRAEVRPQQVMIAKNEGAHATTGTDMGAGTGLYSNRV